MDLRVDSCRNIYELINF